MKSLLIIVLVAVATASAYQVCTPGSYHRKGCNTCVCSEDGKISVCTTAGCPSGVFNDDGSLIIPIDLIDEVIPEASEIEIVKSQLVEIGEVTYVQVCTPDSFFHDDCNLCKCSPLGVDYTCTKIGCPPNVVEINRRVNRIGKDCGKKICSPGVLFKKDCNICICNESGTVAACTKKACNVNLPKGLQVKRSAGENQVCEPGQKFKEYCNDCICSNDGTKYACTRKACNLNVYNEDGSLKAPLTCEPGSTFKKDCNICECSDDGLNAICTAMACKTNEETNRVRTRSAVVHEDTQHWGPLYKHGDGCNPGHVFYSECNQCVCLSDGWSAYCTLKHCTVPTEEPETETETESTTEPEKEE